MKESTYYYDRASDTFKVFATREYDIGDEVMISYLGVRSVNGPKLIIILTNIWLGRIWLIEHRPILLLWIHRTSCGRGLSDDVLQTWTSWPSRNWFERQAKNLYQCLKAWPRQSIHVDEQPIWSTITVHSKVNFCFDVSQVACLTFNYRLLYHPNASAIDNMYHLTPFACPAHDSMPVNARMDMLLEIDRLMRQKLSEYPDDPEPIHSDDSNRVKTLKYLIE